MKTDLYTKSVLTVIAAALCMIVLQNMNIFPEAKAAVKLDVMDINLARVGGNSIYGALPVNVKEMGGNSFYGALPVNIKEVSGSNVSGYMPVDIKAVDGSTIYGGAIPVKTK